MLAIRCDPLFHERNVPRNQPPIDLRPHSVRNPLRDQLRRLPPRIVKPRLLPAPRIGVAVDPVTRAHDQVLVDRPGGRPGRSVRFILEHLPAAIGVERVFRRRVARHDQPGSQADLGIRLQETEIPDDDSHHVLPRLEPGSNIHGFEAPVKKLPAGGPETDRGAVHKHPIAVVRRDMDDEMGGLCVQVEGLAEMEDPVVVGRRRRVGDPRSGPGFFQQIGIDRRDRIIRAGEMHRYAEHEQGEEGMLHGCRAQR